MTPWSSRFDEFHDRAASEAGLSDFGSADYREGLRALLRSLDDSPPHPGAKTVNVESLLVGPLVARLRTQAQWREHPDYRQPTIAAPLIVMGMPRTGTTALHNLLSQDPQFQGIEKWITAAPLPRPPRETWNRHPQYVGAAAATERMAAVAPEVMAAHGVLAHEVDECLLPMAQSFASNWFPSQLDVPLYDRWLRDADETASFRRYADILRLVGLNDSRRWLLKNPSHVFGVEAMLTVFPDGCVVQTHRHPAAALASLVNLLDNIMQAYTGEGIDRARRLARETEFWAEAVRRSMAAQQRYPGRFCNVLQHEIRDDPLGIVRRIYDRFGIPMSPEAETRFRDWAAANPPDQTSAHAYAPIADDGEIVAAFADYIELYAL